MKSNAKLKTNIYIFKEFLEGMTSIKEFDLKILNDSMNKDFKKYVKSPDTEAAMDAISYKDKNDNHIKSKYENNEIFNFFLKHIEVKDEQFILKDAYLQYIVHQASINIEKINERKNKHFSMILMNICSTFEIFLSNLTKFEILNVYKGDAFISKKTLDFKEINNIGSVEKIKEYLVEKYISDFQYKDSNKWIKKFLSIFSKNDSKMKDDDELMLLINKVSYIFLIRNLFVHNNGIVNEKFLSQLSSLNGFQNYEYNLKDKIYLNGEKIKEYLNDFITLGIKCMILNINKNEYFKNEKYKSSIISCIVNAIRDIPDMCILMFEEICKSDVKKIESLDIQNTEITSNLQSKFCIDAINLWLSYYFNQNNNFLDEQKQYYEFIHNKFYGCKHIKLLDSYISQDVTKMVKSSIDFIESNDDKNVKINYISSPIFDIIRDNEEFIEYVKSIRYN
ncbi:hypothetical protein [Apilactobacillus xinyiensis]|uniref:hypothetical protein n=1 Tax=Apilactobacillus xinyiensis TaxID=2841032 RepID=UPI00200FA8BE|nr:hypothetical protein [Apilactobacillus xinyiensis]MCL0330552.1 hypothetical protein [Apilactobacillus xinyiensis]